MNTSHRKGLLRQSLLGAVLLAGIAQPAPTHMLASTSTTALHVLRIVPQDGSTSVPITGAVVVYFDRPVVSLTSLGVPTQSPIQVQPVQPGSGRWLNTAAWIWSPSSLLRGATHYSVTVPAGLTAVDGSMLGASVQQSFETIRPAVSGVTPARDSSGVDARSPVLVHFNQSVDYGSATAAFALHTQGGQRVRGLITWPHPDTLVFTPFTPLMGHNTYSVSVSPLLRSSDGPLTSTSAFISRFNTAGRPTVTETTPREGEHVAAPSSITLQFAAPVDAARVKARLHVIPPVAQQDIYVSDDRLSVTIIGGFKPSAQYQVSLGGAIGVDGQSLPAMFHLHFSTQATPPTIQLSDSKMIDSFDAYRPIVVPFRVINTSEVTVQLYRITRQSFRTLPDGSGWEHPNGNLLKILHRSVKTRLNSPLIMAQDLGDALNAPLTPGYYFLRVTPHGGASDTMAFLVTRSAVTLKSSKSRALVWVTDLRSGRPVKGANVAVMRASNSALLGQGKTGSDGTLISSYSPLPSSYENVQVFVTRPGDVGFADSYWSLGVSANDFNLPAGEAQPPSIRGHMYTDRPIYRPGQMVDFRGILRRDTDGAYGLPARPRTVRVTLAEQSTNKMVYQTRVQLNDFGAFDGHFMLSSSAHLGLMLLTADVNGATSSVPFEVAAYKAPDFKVSAAPADHAGNYTSGQTVHVTLSARYLFGVPLNRAHVQWSIFANPYIFQTPTYGDYTFQDLSQVDFTSAVQSLSPPHPTGYPGSASRADDSGAFVNALATPSSNGLTPVISGTARTDTAGNFILTVPANLRGDNLSQSWNVEATVTDANAASVSGRTTVTVHKGTYYIGLHSSQLFSRAGASTGIDVLTLGQDGVTVSKSIPVTLRLYRRTYHRISSKNYEDWRPVDTFVRAFSTTTGPNGRSHLSISPPVGGEYRLVADGYDSSGHTIRSAMSLYVATTHETTSSWSQPADRVQLVADHALYRVGDVAHILIPAPRAGMTALVTVERGTIYSHQIVHLSGTSTVISMPIQASYLPNVFVSVVLVSGSMPGDPPLWRMGAVELPVDVRAKQISLSLRTNKARAHPRDSVQVYLHASDQQGHPVVGQFSLAVADEGVLSLAGTASSSLLDAFYSERGLAVNTAYSQNVAGFQLSASTSHQKGSDREASVVRSVAALNGRNQGGGGRGGGGGAAISVANPRTNFPDSAYWNPSITTDSSGNATLAVPLPDTLTTWRFTSRGVTTDTKVGESTLDVISTQDLLIRPSIPRFLTLGDQASIGGVVNNTTDHALSASVSLLLSGAGTVAGGNTISTTIVLGPNEERAVTWPISATSLGTMTVQLTASTSNGVADSVRQTISVQPNSTPNVVATSGEVAISRTESISVPPSAQQGEGGLSLVMEPSLAAGLRGTGDLLRRSPYESNQETAARLMGDVALVGLPARLSGLSTADVSAYRLDAGDALVRLSKAQRVGGGWGWWSEDMQSSPDVTAFVLDALLDAKAANLGVSSQIIKSGRDYLSGQTVSQSSTSLGLGLVTPELHAYSAYVLAGSSSAPDTSTIFNTRTALPIWSRSYLLQAIYKENGSHLDERAHVLISELEQDAVLGATGTHWQASGSDPAISDPVYATSSVLHALVLTDPTNPLIASTTRWLMSARQSTDGWQTPVANAVALRALSSELVAAQDAAGQYSFNANFNGVLVVNTGTSGAGIAASQEYTLPVGSGLAPSSTNSITLTRTNTSGHLYYTLRLATYSPIESVPALSNGVSIDRQYVVQNQAVTTGGLGDTVLVRLTITAPQDLYYLNIQDPFPAGAEAVDPSLLTTSLLQQGGYTVPAGATDLAWYVSHVQLHDDHAEVFVQYLPAGTYRYEYSLHLTTAGHFHTRPAVVAESYFPEVSGRSQGGFFSVQ